MNSLINSHDASAVMQRLINGNIWYYENKYNIAPLTNEIRHKTSSQGQNPYAVVISCSDSRVPVEHVFSAGIGELFVIRTVGNVVDNIEIGSVEYAIDELGVPLIVVLGHTHCGAIKAALQGNSKGYISYIIDEINLENYGIEDEEECERKNVENSIKKLMKSHEIIKRVKSGQVGVARGIYDIESGKVDLTFVSYKFI